MSCKQYNMNFNRTGSDVNSKSNVSRLGQILLQLIYRYPGVRYRELLRMTHSSNGVLSYRLTQLERSQDINVNRNQRVTRYYLPDISLEVSKIIGHIKNPISRSILSLLVENGPTLASEISTVTKKSTVNNLLVSPSIGRRRNPKKRLFYFE